MALNAGGRGRWRQTAAPSVAGAGLLLLAAGMMATGRFRLGGLCVAVAVLVDLASAGPSLAPAQLLQASVLDRVGDGAVFAGLAVFHAGDPRPTGVAMLALCLAGVLGSVLAPYTRARAEVLGVSAKVGLLNRRERLAALALVLSAFGQSFGGVVVAFVVGLLVAADWATTAARIVAVGRQAPLDPDDGDAAPSALRAPSPRPSRRETTARPSLRGE